MASTLLLCAYATPAATELSAIPRGFHLVARDDCGHADEGEQPHLLFRAGTPFAIEESARAELGLDDERLFTSVRGQTADHFRDERRYASTRHGRDVVLRYTGLYPDARYAVRLFFYNPEQAAHDQVVLASGRRLTDEPLRLPPGKPVTLILAIPAYTYSGSATLDLEFRAAQDGFPMVSAVELWSDRDNLLPGTRGPHIRFRVDSLPDGEPLNISDGKNRFTSQTVTSPGMTPWIPLKRGVVMLRAPSSGGATILGFFAPEDESLDIALRRWEWDEPGAHQIICDQALLNPVTMRDQERLSYRLTLELAEEKLRPLTRPPLLLGNFWGRTEGPPAEYMVKTLRLMGMNCVEATLGPDRATYDRLYGWTGSGGQYQAPRRVPYDVEAVRAWADKAYSNIRGSDVAVYQLSDEPRQGRVAVDNAEANAGFGRWLTDKNIPPHLFGQISMDAVELLRSMPKDDEDTPENRRRYYWSQRYHAWVVIKSFALSGEALKRHAANPDIEPYVALSGHQFYLTRPNNNVNRMPVDMFDLASYPHLMPGISDWMSPYSAYAGGAEGGQWRFVTHEAVAYSAAFFNTGARRYGEDFGKPPISRSMMHCVGPNLFRAYTMLGNQVKWISYYNYGPRYDFQGNGRVGAWAGLPAAHHAVVQVNNQAALVDDLLGPGVMLPSRVAMLNGRSTDYYGDRRVDLRGRRDLFLVLSHEYYRPEMVTEEQIAEEDALEHYDALYVVDRWVSEPAQEKIAAWVRRGGLLWASSLAMEHNEYNENHDFLEREAGLQRDYTPTGEGGQGVVPVEGESDFEPHGVRRWSVAGTVDWPGARVKARYNDGNPAWLEKELGQGKLVYVLHKPEQEYTSKLWPWRELALWYADEHKANRAVITAPLREAGIERPLSVSIPVMMAAPIGTEDGTVIVFYNMNRPYMPSLRDASRENIEITLKVPGPPHSVRIIRGMSEPEDMPYTYADGAVTVTLPELPGHDDGLMIAVRHRQAPEDDRMQEMMRHVQTLLDENDDWQSLSAGAWFAGFFAEWELAQKLAPLLKHDKWAVRRSAAESLGRLRFSGAAEGLRAAIELENDPHVLADLLIALDRLDHKDTPALAERLVAHHNPMVYYEAANILLRRADNVARARITHPDTPGR